MTAAPGPFLSAVQADLGDSAALQAYQFLAAALTASRVHTFAGIIGRGRPAALAMITEQDRQLARFAPDALAAYPRLIQSMWQHSELLTNPIEYDAVRALLRDAAEVFATAVEAEAA